jgi:hypothetical protein
VEQAKDASATKPGDKLLSVEERAEYETAELVLPETGHRPGCLHAGGGYVTHRIPIDCVTEVALWESIDTHKKTIAYQHQTIIELKARIYDLEHAE